MKTLGTGAAQLNIYFQIGSYRSIIFDFGIDVSAWSFEFVIRKNKGGRIKTLSLTLGSGLSFPIYVTDQVQATFTAANTTIEEGEYYYELRRTDVALPLINGLAYFTFDALDGSEADDTLGLTVSSQTINVTISNAAASSGGVASSRTISTTSPLTGGGDLSADRTFAIAKATSSTDGYLSSADWTTFNGKAPLASPTFTGTPTAPTPTFGDNSTKISTTAFVQSAVSAISTPIELGQIISDDFNRASLGSNWTNVGTGTFTISSNALSVSRSGAISLSNYLLWNAYGNSNLESYTVTYSVTAGTIDANSHGIGLTLQSNGGYSTNSAQIGLNMTNAASQGKISIYYNNSTTATLTSPNGLTITAGDVINMTVKFVKDRYIITAYNQTTGRTNSMIYDCGVSFPRTFIIPNSFRFGVIAIGGTHTVDNFVVVGNDNKSPSIMPIGDSITKGLDVENLANRWTELVNNYGAGFGVTNAGPSNLIEDLNTAEILSLTPQRIIVTVGINNIQKGDAIGTVQTKYSTLISTLVSGGYTVGTNLFLCTLIPNTGFNSTVVTFNSWLLSTYGSAAVIDWYTPLLNAGGTGLRYTLDNVHPTTEGHEIMAAMVISKLNLQSQVKKIGGNKNLYYNANNYVRIADGVNKSGTPRYQLDVVNSSGSVGSQIKVGNNANDEGGWVGSLGASSLVASAGTAWNGATWTFKNASSSSYIQFNGTHFWNVDLAKTIGTTGAGTTIMQLSSTALLSSLATFDVFNTTTTTLNFAGAATTLTIGATTGTATIRNVTTSIKHLDGSTSAPSIAAGAGAGTTPTVSLGTNSTDLAGIINVTTGTTPTGTNAIVVTITFNTAYVTAPFVTLTPANRNAQALTGATAVLVPAAGQTNGVSTTTFVIESGATALTAATSYIWYYQVIQ